MIKTSKIALVCALGAATVISLSECSSARKASAGNKDKGYVQIFDGKTLNNWEGDPTYWRVENGNLVGEITPSTLLKRNSFIIYRGATPGDFEMTVEFRITKGGNSGVNYRSEELSDLKYALKGYQADIDGANHYTGQNYEERRRTTLAYRGEKATINPAPAGTTMEDNVKRNAWQQRTITGSLGNSDSLASLIHYEDWNTCHIIAKGNRLMHYINGVLMSDVTDEDPANRKFSGLIGVQVHVGPPMKVEYRNIMLKQE